jgi:flavodoxin
MAEKALLVYYSRSGKSEILAKNLREKTGWDTDKIEYADKKRISFIGGILEARRKATAKIKGDAHNPAEYRRVIIISPVWAGLLATPVRTYLVNHKPDINSYSIIAVCGGRGFEGTVKEAVTILGKEPVVSGEYFSAQIAKGTYDIEKFVS